MLQIMKKLVKESLYNDSEEMFGIESDQTLSFPWVDDEKTNNFLDRLDSMGIDYDDPGLTGGTSIIIYAQDEESAEAIQNAAAEFGIEYD